ncbi:MAG: type III pantothenate kinase [Thermoguttaceae bacterium]
MNSMPLIAVDIGNARMKLAFFHREQNEGVPEPESLLTLQGSLPAWGRLQPWLDELGHGQLHWFIGSVNRPAATKLLDWLRANRPADPATMLAAGDLPLEVRLDRPDMVGIDRLLDALAAKHFRQTDRPAVVVDVGSAITIDLIDADGAFLGGSILPGIEMSARALHEYTDLLPQIAMAELDTPPPVLGTSTIPAMRSGLFWGMVGAVRQLTEKLAEQTSGDAEVFLTGGAGKILAELLGAHAQHVPQLTLAGIALAARHELELKGDRLLYRQARGRPPKNQTK